MLPIELSLPSFPTEEKPPEEFEKLYFDRLQLLIGKISEDRQAARRNIERAQEKQARLHDRKLKTHRYNIGDKVLLKDFRAKKMDPKWLGPYYIHDIKLNGTYKLRTLDNKLCKKLVHADQIVPYIDRTN